jgi:DNA-binding NtrC family response regulator
VTPVPNKKVACLCAHDPDTTLSGVLRDSGWEIERLDVISPVRTLSLPKDCSVGILVLTSKEPAWLGKLLSIVPHLKNLNWIAIVDRALVGDPAIREFIAVHCVDYQTVPLERDRVLFALGHVAGMAALTGQAAVVHAAEVAADLFGNTPVMQTLRSDLSKIAAVDAPVLVTGESGTGKECVARAIHEMSNRREQPFVAINCVSLPPSLIHAELFGFERGAFTGAHHRKVGHIEAAHRGTILLDEIGDLHPELQALLLRFVEEQAVRRVGGRDEIRVDTRVVAATNVDLEAAIKRGDFRSDLYYRLNILRVRTPPLRDRRADIEPLARMFLKRFGVENSHRPRGFSESALAAMYRHDWPGNVRELLNRVRRAIVMCEGRLITPGDLNFGVDHQPLDLNLETARVEAERKTILTALQYSGGNACKSAQMVGVSRATFYRLLEKHSVALSERTALKVAP